MRFALFLLIAAPAVAGDFTTNIGDASPHSISSITTDSAGNTYLVGTVTLTSTAAVFLSKLDPSR